MRRRTAALILRPAITCWPAVVPANACTDLQEQKNTFFPVSWCFERHVVIERFRLRTHPMLNVGGCAKLKPPPGVPCCCGAMEGLAGAAGGAAAAPAPKVKTPGLLFVDPNPLAPPNWKPPGGHRVEEKLGFERLEGVEC